jgi:hypothetical protein
LGTLQPLASESGKWLLPGIKQPFKFSETYRLDRQQSAKRRLPCLLPPLLDVCLLAGSSRLVRDVEASLAQTVEVHLKLWAQREELTTARVLQLADDVAKGAQLGNFRSRTKSGIYSGLS